MGSKIELGTKVKDVLTGVTGIAYSRTEYMTGCAHIGIRRPAGKDGKVPNVFYCDEPMCKVVGKTKVKLPNETKKSRRGGPRPHPVGRDAPNR